MSLYHFFLHQKPGGQCFSEVFLKITFFLGLQYNSKQTLSASPVKLLLHQNPGGQLDEGSWEERSLRLRHQNPGGQNVRRENRKGARFSAPMFVSWRCSVLIVFFLHQYCSGHSSSLVSLSITYWLLLHQNPGGHP